MLFDAFSRISKRQPGGKVISKGRRLETGAEALAILLNVKFVSVKDFINVFWKTLDD